MEIDQWFVKQNWPLVPLREENVGYVSHWFFVDGIDWKNSDMKIYDGGLSEQLRGSVFVIASRFNWQNICQLETLLIIVN